MNDYLDYPPKQNDPVEQMLIDVDPQPLIQDGVPPGLRPMDPHKPTAHENDTRAATKKARREYRDMLRNAVKEELAKTPLDTSKLIQTAHDSIVSDVVRKLENKFFSPKAIDDLIGKVLTHLILKELGAGDLKKLITAAAQAKAAEVVDRNFMVSLREDTI